MSRPEVAIRPLNAGDCGRVAEWLSRPTIHRWLGSPWRGGPVDPMRVAVALRDRRSLYFMVSADGAPCGVVALSDIDAGDRIAMVWYFLGEDALAGRGVMTEAVLMACADGFGALGLRTIHAWVHPPNLASLRLLKKAGFRPAGVLRDASEVEGVRTDRLLFDLCAGDREAARGT